MRAELRLINIFDCFTCSTFLSRSPVTRSYTQIIAFTNTIETISRCVEGSKQKPFFCSEQKRDWDVPDSKYAEMKDAKDGRGRDLGLNFTNMCLRSNCGCKFSGAQHQFQQHI